MLLLSGIASVIIISLFDLFNLIIKLYIKFLKTAPRVGTPLLTNKWLALVHLGSLNRILRASLTMFT